MAGLLNRSLDELWRLVRRIPAGQVISYGDLGKLMKHPATGRVVGRWMAQAPSDVPWWRVVARDGTFPIGKRGPKLSLEQEQLLREEAVPFLNSGRVDISACSWEP